MTVRELIIQLESYDPDMRVIDQESGNDITIEKGADDDNNEVVEIVLE